MATSNGSLKGALRIVLPALLALSLVGCAATDSAGDERVCGIFGIEAVTFENWRDIANQGLPAPTIGGYAYDPMRIDRPGRPSLVGYRVSASKRSETQRALLFLQGNAMRADQLRQKLTFFADRGMDVFIFDYRGYGGSDGVPLLKPISEDQAEIADFIKDKGYEQAYLYGMSMGGIFAMGPHMRREAFDAIAIDSSPAKLPWYSFCPDEYDPIANVPDDASNIIVLSGGQDRIVPADDVAPLGEAVAARGGVYAHEPELGHPLGDGVRFTLRRFSIVADFFDRTAGQAAQ